MFRYRVIAAICVALFIARDAHAQLGSEVIHQFLLTHAAAVQQDEAPERLPGESKAQIKPQDAQRIFRSVDDILKWTSNDTGLPIQSEVKRALASRAEMQQYNEEALHGESGAEDLRRMEAVIKKFGLVPRSFELEPFLMKLLREQVVAFYFPETKTIYVLDWIDPSGLRPVLAHELTHALQDQAIDIANWTKPTENSAGSDDAVSARRAVLEGQGMITMLDYVEEPRGRSALSAIDDVQTIVDQLTMPKDSPVYRSAPIYMRDLMTFPYRYGMQFERELLAHGGRKLAFDGVLRDPPANTLEIMEPKRYLQHDHIAALAVLNTAGMLAGQYQRFATGSMGASDVHTMTEQFAKAALADKLAREWRGGYYIAFQKNGTIPEKGSAINPADVQLLYVSRWSSANAADQFFDVYTRGVQQRYSEAKLESDSHSEGGARSARWLTPEGEVLIHRAGDAMIVCEGFPSDMSSRMREAALGALRGDHPASSGAH